MRTIQDVKNETTTVKIEISEKIALEGLLALPKQGQSMVIFVHGSGSSRLSPRNQYVAKSLNQTGLGTLLFDLLVDEEESIDRQTGYMRFDIDLLTDRVVGATDWLIGQRGCDQFNLGYFGASTGTAAALVAAAQKQDLIKAIVSRGGRPDLAPTALPEVKAPTLLIVGSRDTTVIKMNQRALEQIQTEKKIEIVPGASHLFEETGALEKVAQLAADWFGHYLNSQAL